MYTNMLGSANALRDNGKVVRADVRSLIMRSLPKTQQLCALTEETAVRAANKFRFREYSFCQPFSCSFSFFSLFLFYIYPWQSALHFLNRFCGLTLLAEPFGAALLVPPHFFEALVADF